MAGSMTSPNGLNRLRTRPLSASSSKTERGVEHRLPVCCRPRHRLPVAFEVPFRHGPAVIEAQPPLVPDLAIPRRGDVAPVRSTWGIRAGLDLHPDVMATRQGDLVMDQKVSPRVCLLLGDERVGDVVHCGCVEGATCDLRRIPVFRALTPLRPVRRPGHAGAGGQRHHETGERGQHTMPEASHAKRIYAPGKEPHGRNGTRKPGACPISVPRGTPSRIGER
jgi:hypothetical protein